MMHYVVVVQTDRQTTKYGYPDGWQSKCSCFDLKDQEYTKYFFHTDSHQNVKNLGRDPS